MAGVWKMASHMDDITEAYRILAKIPAIVGGRLHNSGNKITATWSVRNFDKNVTIPYLCDYFLDNNLAVIAKSDFGVDVSNVVISSVSPQENFKALIREENSGKDKKAYLEVWSRNSLDHSIDLTTLDLHGSVYADTEFGCLNWSPDEKSLVYVAEKKIPKSEPFIKRTPVSEDQKKGAVPPGKGYLYREDWGEQLVGKIQTVVVVCTVETETLRLVKGLPEDWCPGQVRFLNDSETLVGVALKLVDRRLGLIYCTNRPGFVFSVPVAGGPPRILSIANHAVRSPRLAPNGDLYWLQRESWGPHHACHEIVRLPAEVVNNPDADPEESIVKVVNIVKDKRDISNGEFYGMYHHRLPTNCFSSDGKRLFFCTVQQNEIRSYVVNIASGELCDISNKAGPGSTTLLSVQSDVVLAACASLNLPAQLYVAKLPPSGQEAEIQWIRVSEPVETPTNLSASEVRYLDLEQTDTDDSIKSFTAIYFGPIEGTQVPLIVWPHGGPHAAFSNIYMLEIALFRTLGFALLLVNYRGSTGAGDDSVHYLPSRIGDADVKDCYLATMESLDKFPIDRDKVVLCGGSHGGFLVTHLSGRYPDLYKAVVARNPVIDLSTMNNTSDIPDCDNGFSRHPGPHRRRCGVLSGAGGQVPSCGTRAGRVLRRVLVDFLDDITQWAPSQLYSGFGVLCVNYRGSTGNGDSSLRCLMGHIGDYDVNDCLLALNTVRKGDEISQQAVVLYGGSFGGFTAAHLAGRFPDMFKAMVLRNPLIDLATKESYCDNPDGCSVEIGIPFTEEGPESEEKLLSLRRCSPIVHAHRVRAPTALMLGSSDRRVPYYQGLEYSRRLRANGIKTRVFLYDDNHSLSSLPAEMDNLINGADWLISAINPEPC